MTLDPVVVWVARCGLALLFGAAALHKLRDAPGFRRALGAYHLLPPWLVAPAAAGFVSVECGAAAALLLPDAASGAALVLAGLLLVYSFAIAVNLSRGRRIDCGCSGPAASQPLSGSLLARNALLLAAAGLAAAPPTDRALAAVDLFTIAAALLTTTALFQAAQLLAGAAATHALSRRTP